MAKKSQQDLKKKQRNQIIMLVVILVAFLALMVFVTLPALGINLFGGSSSSKPKTVTNTVNTAAKTTTTPVNNTSTAIKTNVDKNMLEKALNKPDDDITVEYYTEDAFEPYYFNFKDDEQVKDILVNSANVIEFDDAIFMSYFLSEDGEKTAWIKTSAEPNKVYELKINSRVPNVPYPLQVIDITPMGVLLYRYPDAREKEQEETPRLYRLLARPYIEITELKATIQ
jgi:hypothetical protein